MLPSWLRLRRMFASAPDRGSAPVTAVAGVKTEPRLPIQDPDSISAWSDYHRSITITLPSFDTLEEWLEYAKTHPYSPPTCLCAWYERCSLCDPDYKPPQCPSCGAKL